jgi:hypothetical protein
LVNVLIIKSSQLVWDCLQNVLLLEKCNKFALLWLPGHRGIVGNERSDALARKGSAIAFTGPEPVFGITKATAHGPIFDWVKGQHQERWMNLEGHRHSKVMMDKPSLVHTADMLRLSRPQIGVVARLIMGH